MGAEEPFGLAPAQPPDAVGRTGQLDGLGKGGLEVWIIAGCDGRRDHVEAGRLQLELDALGQGVGRPHQRARLGVDGDAAVSGRRQHQQLEVGARL